MLPHISDHGTGAAIVVLHGTPYDPDLIEQWAAPWVDAFRVLVVHRPGYGRSRSLGCPPVATATELVERALVERGVAAAHFVGASWGAYLAVDIAQRARVRALSFVALAGFVDLGAEHRAALRGFATALRGPLDLERILSESHLSPGARAAHPTYARQTTRAFATPDLADDLIGIADAPSRLEALRALRVRGLSLRGSLDTSMPREPCEAFAQACTPGTYEELDGLGHVPMVEDGPTTARRIVDWLST